MIADDHAAGAQNLASFVAANAGRHGSVADVAGGVAVASVVPIAHGYVNAAVPVDLTVSASAFLAEAAAFFDRLDRSFVVWVPGRHDDLRNEAIQRGGQPHASRTPAMAIRSRPMFAPNGFSVRLVESAADRDLFATTTVTFSSALRSDGRSFSSVLRGRKNMTCRFGGA